MELLYHIPEKFAHFCFADAEGVVITTRIRMETHRGAARAAFTGDRAESALALKFPLGKPGEIFSGEQDFIEWHSPAIGLDEGIPQG